jgi:hypothetical protein
MKKPTARLALSKKEVDAVYSYIFPHVRAYPESTGFAVWQKMFDFVSEQDALEQQRKEERAKRRQENAPIELDFE